MAASAPSRAVAIVGDVYVDVLAKVQELPVWGEDRAASTALLSPGGSTANTARFLGALDESTRVTLFSAIGDDSAGAYFRSELQKEGCVACDEASLVALPGVPTAVCIVLSGPADRGFVSCNASNGAITPAILSRERLLAHGHCHFGGFFNLPGLHTPDVVELARELRAAGVTITLDTQYDISGAWDGGGTLDALLQLVDAFMPNELEAMGVAREGSAERALDAILARMRPGALAIVKVGARGALAARAAADGSGQVERWHERPPPVEVVDPTGAGDAFNASFIHAFVRGRPVDECLRAGCVGGALSVSRLGGCDGVREWADDVLRGSLRGASGAASGSAA